jgi:uncharacterized membrane protein (UPF0182 family)
VEPYPRDRVQAVAPWLTVDGDSYPAVVDGRIVWIVDGYTTSNSYPYSRAHLAGRTSTTDSVSATSTSIATQAPTRSTTSATPSRPPSTRTTAPSRCTSGTSTDPVLKVWEKAFPGTVKPYSDISPT